MRFGVLGSGPVGQVLAKGLKRHGHDVRICSRTPKKLAEFSAANGILSGTFADVDGQSVLPGREAHHVLLR